MSARHVAGWGVILASVLALAVATRHCGTAPTAHAAAAIIRTGSAQPVVAGFDLSAPITAWQLPPALREVSGLAVAGPGRVMAHGDEVGRVFEIDYDNGKVVREFTLGAPPIRADFEGIEVVGSRLIMMSSDGRLFSGELPVTGTIIGPVLIQDTGLGRRCEAEGLAVDRDGTLLLPCKQPRGRAATRNIEVWAWSPIRAALEPQARAVFTFDRSARAMQPSAIAVTTHATYLVLFGSEHAIGEFARDGMAIALWSLDRRRHPQPEGLALTPDGRLLIADEGRGRGEHGRITVYGRAR